jgi:hypothetical protein
MNEDHYYENLYLKLGIANGSIRYIKNSSLTNFEWIQKVIPMHPPPKCFSQFQRFHRKEPKITKHKTRRLS